MLSSRLGSRDGCLSKCCLSKYGKWYAKCALCLVSVLAANGVLVVLDGAAAQAAESGNAVSSPANSAAVSGLPQNSESSGPVIAIVRPTSSDLLHGDRAQVVIAVKEGRYPLHTVEMWVDDRLATPGAVLWSSLSAPVFDWNTTHFTDGPHRLKVRVTDTQGFAGMAEVTIYINNNKKRDTLPPVLEWLNVEPGQILRSVQEVQLKVVDNFGVKLLFVYLNPLDSPNAKQPLRSWLLNVPPYKFNLETTTGKDGIYVLDALALDALENEGKAPRLYIGISNNAIYPSWYDQLMTLANRSTGAAGLANAMPGANQQSEIRQPRLIETPRVVSAPGLTKLPERIAHGALNSRAARSAVSQAERNQRSLIATLPLSEQHQSPRIPAQIPAAPPAPSNKATSSVNSEKQPATTPLAVASGTPMAPLVGRAGKSTANGARVEGVRPKSATERALSVRVVPPSQQTRLAMSQVPEYSSVPSTPPAPRALASLPPAPQESVTALAPPRSRDSISERILSLPTLAARSSQKANGAIAVVGLARQPSTRVGAGVRAPRPARPRVAALSPGLAAKSRAAAITVAVGQSALPQIYVTQRNETLSAIAKRFALPVQVLAANNDLAPTARLPKGTTVRLPQTLSVNYKGKPVTGDVAALLVGSTSITPFRFLFERQGGTLYWDAKKQQVLARNVTHEVTLTIGSRAAVVNRQQVMMDLAAFLLSGRTMVPLRFFEKALHAQVEWEPSTGRFYIAMAN